MRTVLLSITAVLMVVLMMTTPPATMKRVAFFTEAEWAELIGNVEAAPVPPSTPDHQAFHDLVEKWARFYMPFPVVRVEISPADKFGYSDVMIEMRVGSEPITMSGRMNRMITESAIKDFMISASMAATDAVLKR